MNDQNPISLAEICRKQREEVAAHVRKLAVDILCVDSAWPTDEAVLADAPSADSLDIVELQVGLEDAYDIILPDEEMARVATIGDLIALVANKLG